MYLVDGDIWRRLEELGFEGSDAAHPFDAEKQIQPCSIDLRISNVFWKPSRRRRVWRRLLPGRVHAIDLRHSQMHDLDPLRDWKRVVLGPGDVLTIRPGETVMGRIYERFRVPRDLAGKIEGRSSFARLGLAVHCTGDFINPGWEGFMPLQLVNAGPYPLRITPYLPVCQLMLVALSDSPQRAYGDPGLESKYRNDDGGPSLWWRDAQVRALQKQLGEAHATERMQQDIIERVGFESADVLERFQSFVRTRRVGDVEHTDQLLGAFAAQEDRRRLRDRVVMALPAILLGAVLGSLSQPAVWPVVLGVVTLCSVFAALSAYVRHGAGYLGGAELRTTSNRPAQEAS